MKKIFLLALTLGVFFAISGCSSPSGGSSDPDPASSYTVTFEPNGGSGTMTAQSIANGATAALTANAFTKAGENFAGWATTPTSTVSYPDRASYTMGSSNVTLYATWTTQPSYTVTFDPNGGSGSMSDQSIVSGATATLSANTFTKSGLNFAGWSTTTTGSVAYTDGARYPMGAANVTLYAIWTTTPSYTVTFNSNGGSGTMSDQSIVSGTAANLSANIFTKTGYSFAGWSTTTTGPVSYTEGASYPMGTANVTLYAIWTITPSYTVTFDANGGSGSMTAQSIVSRATVNLSPNTFTNTGYSFAGWATTKTGLVDYTDGASYTMKTANTTLYAIWITNGSLDYSLINNNTEYEVSCGTFTGTALTIPEYHQGKKVTAIAYHGFYQKTQLTSISLPSSITSIGDFAFYRCTGLTGTLIIPSSVTSIGSSAFYRCTGLTGTLIIPSSVTSIGDLAFGYCTGLTGSLTIPYGVEIIGAQAFDNCTGLTGSLTISSSVTSIGSFAFLNCTGLTGSLTIPSSVTSIGDGAFEGCSGFTGDLTIPSSVTSIGSSVFADCTGLNGKLSIPSSMTSIKHSTFYRCAKLTGPLTIPSSVKSIENSAFNGCSGFTGDLTIPSSVTSIGDGAFQRCSGFTGDLTIPSSVTSIGDSAFSECTELNGKLTIPSSITSIKVGTFYRCSKLTGPLMIPSSVTSIERSAFYGCSGLTGSLTIPDGVTLIKQDAFSDCSGLTGSLTIPEGVTSIGIGAFNGCSGLTGSLTIPPRVTSIGAAAFANCYKLAGSLTIPSSVTSIGQYAFSNFSGIVTIDATTPPTLTGSGVFNTSKTTAIKVPAASVNAYKTASYWSTYAGKIVAQ